MNGKAHSAAWISVLLTLVAGIWHVSGRLSALEERVISLDERMAEIVQRVNITNSLWRHHVYREFPGIDADSSH